MGTVGFCVLITYRFLYHMKEMHEYSTLARSFLSVSSEVDEILIVDEDLNIVCAKHWLRQSHTHEFSFEEMIRSCFIDHDEAMDLCEKSLEKGLYFEDVFQTVKENRWDVESFIRIRILPLFIVSSTVPSYRAIILSDLTLYKNELKKESFSSSRLEHYIDTAPYGLIYMNANGTIVGVNETLKQWLCVSKSFIIGQPFFSLSEEMSCGIETVMGAEEGIQIKLKQNKTGFIHVLLFSTKIFDDYYILTLFKQNSYLKYWREDFLEFLPIPSLVINKTGCIQMMNTTLNILLQKKQEKQLKIGHILGDYLDEISRKSWNDILNMGGGVKRTFELHFENSDFTVVGNIKKLEKEEFLVQLMDTSEQKKLEQQFFQAQKTQAVGQLAGGIAHDFNNLLTAIIGFCDLLLQRVMPNDPSFADIMHIKQNANRASNLVKQLLAFSRRQSLQPRKINVTEIMSDLSALLRRLIGSQINLKLIQNRNLWPVKVDVGQFEQVIINLVVNARDAMEKGGDLIIETSNYSNTVPKNLGNDVMLVGDYVLISVKDTGCGIPADLVKSIFEPFFSTKPKGRGTGLGLATAYGIVKQTGGALDVESYVEKGTTFKVFLPRCKDKDEVLVQNKNRIQDVTGTETVLLVEDEDAVRIFASRALRDKGYRVFEAANGKMALNLIHEGIKPNILITDVSMSEMDGQMLSQKVKEIFPNLPVIFMSGYAEETFRKDLSENKSMHFLPKPFTLRDLASKVREILG